MKKLFSNFSLCVFAAFAMCGVSMTSCSSSSSDSDSDLSAEFIKSLSEEDLGKIKVYEGESIIGAKHIPYNGKDACDLDLELIKMVSGEAEDGSVDLSSVSSSKLHRFDSPNKGAYLQEVIKLNGGDRTLYYSNVAVDDDEYTGAATSLQNPEEFEAELDGFKFDEESDSTAESADPLAFRALKIIVFSTSGQLKSRMWFTDATIDGVKERVVTLIAQE